MKIYNYPLKKEKIYLLRHPETECKQEYCYGNSNVKLAEKEYSKLDYYRKKISKLDVKKIYSSDLDRCTALLKNRENLTISDQLREIDFGSWELKKWNDIPKIQIEKWSKNLYDYTFPNGESLSLFMKRVQSYFINGILPKLNGEPILIITHAGVIRTILSILTGTEYSILLKETINYTDLILISENNVSFLGSL